MSDRKLFGVLSGAQITILGSLAILAPTALYATVSYQAVGIVNPNTGTLGYVDPSGSLHTSDEYAYYRNNPLNYVDIVLPADAGSASGCDTSSYTVPAGKALIITSVTGNFNNYDGTDVFSGFYLYSSASCSGNPVIIQFDSVPATLYANAPKNYLYGNGVPVPAGSVLSQHSDNDDGYTLLHGFLVPANLVSQDSYTYGAKSIRPHKMGAVASP